MKLKSLFIFLLALVFCMNANTSAQAVPNAEEAIKAIVFEACETQLGLTEDGLKLYNLVNTDDGGWAFSLTVIDADPTTNGLVIGAIDSHGQLVSLTGPQTISLYEQVSDAWARVARDYRAVYQFKQVWQPLLTQLDPQQQAEFDSHSNTFPIVDLVNHDIRLPSEQAITYDEAVQKSREAILSMPGWTEEMVDLLRISTEAYHVPVSNDRDVYQFVYGLGSSVGHLEMLLSGESYHFDYNKYADKEDAIFGNALPTAVSVRIDALTGDVVGEVYVQIVPDFAGDPMVFLLWE